MAVPLVIDNAKIASLKQFAEDNPIFMNELIEISEGRKPPVGDREGYGLDLPVNFRVVFSVEEHPQKDGGGTMWFKHMSMSLAVPGRVPSVPAVHLVCEELGFPPLEECHIDIENNCEYPYVEVIGKHE